MPSSTRRTRSGRPGPRLGQRHRRRDTTGGAPAGSGRGLSRRDFLRTSGAGLGALGLKIGLGAAAGGAGSLIGPGCNAGAADEDLFRFVVMADTHIIDSFYEGPEGSPEDTESIFHTEERLAAARDVVNAIQPAVEQVFICGDVVHNYPSTEWDFYFQNETRWDICKSLLDGFAMPVHPGLGNHDYGVPEVTRTFTHDLFREKLGISPYYGIEHKGFLFLHVNNFLGDTWDPASAGYDKDRGSLGETQLQWLEAELQRGMPTFVFLHFPLASMESREVADLDIKALLLRYQETIQLVVSGHWHIWMDNQQNYGPPHLLAASTRYDPDAFLVIETDRRHQTHRILNWDQLVWFAHDTDPWQEPA